MHGHSNIKLSFTGLPLVGDYVFGSRFESPFIIGEFIDKIRLLGLLIDKLKITFKTLPMLYPLKARVMKQRVENYSRIAYYRVVTLSDPNRWALLDGFLIVASISLVWGVCCYLWSSSTVRLQSQGNATATSCVSVLAKFWSYMKCWRKYRRNVPEEHFLSVRTFDKYLSRLQQGVRLYMVRKDAEDMCWMRRDWI